MARLAGVSLPTVSRVLTGSTPVTPPTRQRVMSAIDELGFRPNGAARALVRGQQPIVGVVTADTFGFGRARMLLHIEEKARRDGYVVAVVVVDAQGLRANPGALDVLMAQPIVGAIVLDYGTHDHELIHRIFGSTPLATVADGDEGDIDVAKIVVDDFTAARAITRHLLELGHRTVHHVAVPGVGGRPHVRELGWREALSEAGIDDQWSVMSDWSLESGRALGRRLSQDPSVTAVFCSNDQLAFGVMRGLHDMGLKIPEDVSVAGLDDEPLAAAWMPSLTTYRLDWDWAGGAVYELLASQISGSGTTAEPDLRLVQRESTAPPSTHRTTR